MPAARPFVPVDRLRRPLSDYGMLGVLLLLCLVFSIATNSEQPLTGPAAARQVAGAIVRQSGRGARVLIAVRPQPDDLAYARSLQAELATAGATVAEVVAGEP